MLIALSWAPLTILTTTIIDRNLLLIRKVETIGKIARITLKNQNTPILGMTIPIIHIINHKDLMWIHLNKDQDNPEADLKDSKDNDKLHAQAVKSFTSNLTEDSQDFDPLADVRKPLDLGSDHGGSTSFKHSNPLSDWLRLSTLQHLSATSHIGLSSFPPLFYHHDCIMPTTLVALKPFPFKTPPFSTLLHL
ncbi:hypothetical protein BJV74DRAFT_881235 [Russula compacta]|nr:hypothetical protein BJV74DRAFT_881235 [Russula compacta]